MASCSIPAFQSLLLGDRWRNRTIANFKNNFPADVSRKAGNGACQNFRPDHESGRLPDCSFMTCRDYRVPGMSQICAGPTWRLEIASVFKSAQSPDRGSIHFKATH